MTEPRNHSQPADRLGASPWAAARDEELNVALVRIIDGEDVAGEWERFQVTADAHPALWRELAVGQRDERLLHQALAARIDGSSPPALADALEDAWRGGAEIIPIRTAATHPAGAGARLGWAMAACIAGAWVLSAGLTSRQRASDPGPEGLAGSGHRATADNALAGAQAPVVQPAAFLSPHQALDAYLELGQKSGAVVGELPGKPIIERRALEDGAGYEVIFVRQIVERGRVPAMYSFEPSNEFGTPVPTPVKDAPKRRDPL